MHKTWFEVNYKDKECSKVHIRNLGMGTMSETWYGIIDARLRGLTHDDDDDVILLCDEDDKGLSQAIGSAVVASFVERKLHPKLAPLYPCIFLNCSSVTFIFYDCENDFLVITDRIDLYSNHRRVDKSTILALWLVLNHR